MMTFVVSLVPTADAQPPIKVGQISAWDYPGGQGVKRGVQMAIRDINAAGGLLGGKVESIFYDNKCDVDEAKKATERLLYKDKVDAIFGFWRSALAIVCQPLVMEAKKILLLGAPATPVVTYEPMAKDYNTHKYTFTSNPNSFFTMGLLEMSIIWARDKLGLDKIAYLAEKAAWYDPVYDLYLYEKAW